MMTLENQSYEEETHSLPKSNGSKSILHDPLSSPSTFVDIPTGDSDPLHSPSPDRSPSSLNTILEPPSYAEAVFGSFDLDSPSSINGGHDHSTLSDAGGGSQSFSSDFLKISVSDPLKEQEMSNSLVPGGSYYYSYLISTFTNLSEYSGNEFNVRRRFKDVVALSDRLGQSYRGFFIPLRPDKSVVESQVMQQNEFVEQRRIALEKYLSKLADHPVIRRSEELRMFLEASGKMPLVRTTDVASRMLDGAVRLPKQLMGAESVVGGVADVSELTQPAKGGRDLLRIFKELKQSVTNDWGAAKPLLLEEDKEFLERKEKLQDFEQQLSNVSLQDSTDWKQLVFVSSNIQENLLEEVLMIAVHQHHFPR